MRLFMAFTRDARKLMDLVGLLVFRKTHQAAKGHNLFLAVLLVVPDEKIHIT